MLILLASAAAVAIYLLRLFAMKGTTHRHLTISFHEALFALCVWSGFEAWQGTADVGHVAGLVASILWLRESWPTWGIDRPPPHTETGPMPLEQD